MTISLPESVAKEVKRDVKAEGFASASEYFRHVLREYRAERLASELRQERKAFDLSEGTKLRSLKDLR